MCCYTFLSIKIVDKVLNKLLLFKEYLFVNVLGKRVDEVFFKFLSGLDYKGSLLNKIFWQYIESNKMIRQKFERKFFLPMMPYLCEIYRELMFTLSPIVNLIVS